MKGIDVSKWQGAIDWNKVKASGIEFAIIRAGTGSSATDIRFTQNIQGAINAGLYVGVYWFSYAISEETARKEAEYCMKVISPYKDKLVMGVYFDWEYDSMKYAKSKGVNPTKKLITDMHIAFCKAIAEGGYKAGYYLNLDYSKNWVDESKLKAYKRWFARYTTTEQKDTYLWQYSSTGSVPGISGNVDMDKCMGSIGGEVRYKAHVADEGWQDWKKDGELAGTTGKSKAIECIIIDGDAKFKYQMHCQNIGDTEVCKNGEQCGTTGRGLRGEAIKIDCDKPIIYRVHVQNYGWLDWVTNGTWTGTKGESKRLEAIELKYIV